MTGSSRGKWKPPTTSFVPIRVRRDEPASPPPADGAAGGAGGEPGPGSTVESGSPPRAGEGNPDPDTAVPDAADSDAAYRARSRRRSSPQGPFAGYQHDSRTAAERIQRAPVRWYHLLLVLVGIGCVVGAGYLVFRG